MTDARERLNLAMAKEMWVRSAPPWEGLTPEGRAALCDEAGLALDAALAHPDDLIALLVERGALSIVGHGCERNGRFEVHMPSTLHMNDEPVYRQVREEAP